ncbi:hypothetical protein FISHEDRAFT_70069 [Fistulina hepatica ATCC 64428]|uniref:Uncharacterized protein n=1 Tax=Fistulina hepatica ATCC 64428 TaxID=1128425 RepID=A0A0D7AJS3_9AGAR|nr:hypothetical protein FISHEDRAFT_70069 [Fistulina hepatica ATCC 64428]
MSHELSHSEYWTQLEADFKELLDPARSVRDKQRVFYDVLQKMKEPPEATDANHSRILDAVREFGEAFVYQFLPNRSVTEFRKLVQESIGIAPIFTKKFQGKSAPYIDRSSDRPYLVCPLVEASFVEPLPVSVHTQSYILPISTNTYSEDDSYVAGGHSDASDEEEYPILPKLCHIIQSDKSKPTLVAKKRCYACRCHGILCTWEDTARGCLLCDTQEWVCTQADKSPFSRTGLHEMYTMVSGNTSGAQSLDDVVQKGEPNAEATVPGTPEVDATPGTGEDEGGSDDNVDNMISLAIEDDAKDPQTTKDTTSNTAVAVHLRSAGASQKLTSQAMKQRPCSKAPAHGAAPVTTRGKFNVVKSGRAGLGKNSKITGARKPKRPATPTLLGTAGPSKKLRTGEDCGRKGIRGEEWQDWDSTRAPSPHGAVLKVKLTDEQLEFRDKLMVERIDIMPYGAYPACINRQIKEEVQAFHEYIMACADHRRAMTVVCFLNTKYPYFQKFVHLSLIPVNHCIMAMSLMTREKLGSALLQEDLTVADLPSASSGPSTTLKDIIGLLNGNIATLLANAQSAASEAITVAQKQAAAAADAVKALAAVLDTQGLMQRDSAVLKEGADPRAAGSSTSAHGVKGKSATIPTSEHPVLQGNLHYPPEVNRLDSEECEDWAMYARETQKVREAGLIIHALEAAYPQFAYTTSKTPIMAGMSIAIIPDDQAEEFDAIREEELAKRLHDNVVGRLYGDRNYESYNN